MRKLVVALRVLLALALGLLSDSPAEGDTDAGAPHATMTCERVDAPGRVHCDVEARVASGETITWGDVVITATPAFVGALRGRIGPHDATARDPEVWRWALALVAHDKGGGDVMGHVRLVVCKSGSCSPRDLPVTARVTVGD